MGRSRSKKIANPPRDPETYSRCVVRKQRVLEQVIRQYIESGDFNGLFLDKDTFSSQQLSPVLARRDRTQGDQAVRHG